MARSSSPECGTSHTLLPMFRWQRMLASSCHPSEQRAEGAFPMAAQEASEPAPCTGALRQLWCLIRYQVLFKLACFGAMESWIAAARALPHSTLRATIPRDTQTCRAEGDWEDILGSTGCL